MGRGPKFYPIEEAFGGLKYKLTIPERAIEEGLGADGPFVAINNRVSQSVSYVHIHLVPRHRKDGLKGFFWPQATLLG